MSDCGKYRPWGKELATIQSHLPVGWAWIASRLPGKKFYQLIDALSGLYVDMSNDLCYLHEELNPYKTTDLLPEWERAVGLPDECFPSGQTIEQRRADVVQKLKRSRYTLIDTWRELAVAMGISAVITPGDLVSLDRGYDYAYPIIYGGWQAGGRFRIYIEAEECHGGGYDYAYPIIYGNVSGRCQEFQCVIERIRPANVVVIWGSPPKPPQFDDVSFDQDNFTFDNISETF